MNDMTFVAACERALNMHATSPDRVARMREVVAATSWDATAAAMDSILQELVGPSSVQPPIEAIAAPVELRGNSKAADLASLLGEMPSS